MSSHFTPKRSVRLLVSLVLIVAGTYFLMDYFTVPKSDVAKIPELTANCIKLKKIVIDENITDVNCSHENDTDRYFFSVSDEFRTKAEKEFPFKKLVINCRTKETVTVVKRSDTTADGELEEFIKEKNFCTNQNFFTSHTEYSYVDHSNMPFLVIDFLTE